MALLNVLGSNIWNSDGELVIDGVPVPHSKRDELLDYAVSSWRTKYLHEPVGSTVFAKLIKDKHTPNKILGKKFFSA